MKRKLHGNSNKNDDPNHLYEIRDKADGQVFKYGISKGKIGDDGLSNRVRVQVRILNLGAGWLRYFGRILIVGIKGRSAAKKIEKEHIDQFNAQKGRLPRGNQK